MKFTDILKSECVKVPLTATDKKAALDEMVDLLAENGLCAQPDLIKEAVWQRENTRSTGIGHGLAIPHGKCTSVDKLTAAIAIPVEPIEFGSVDGNPVDLLIMLISPPDKTTEHIQALAKVSRMMTDDAFRMKVKQASSGQELFDMLLEQEQAIEA